MDTRGLKVKLTVMLSVLLLLATNTQLTSCGGAGEGPAQPAKEPSFELNAVEQAALQANDESALTVNFGDPLLGGTFYEVPPVNAALASGEKPVEDSKTASKWNNRKHCWKHHKRFCCTCEPQDCLRITGICSLTERFTKASAGIADVTYVAQVQFDGETGKKSEIEVTFVRDGNEVGRAETDVTGKATFVEHDVPRGPHKLYVQVAQGYTGTCQQSAVDVTFTRTTATVSSQSDLSSVTLKFCNGCVQRFDCLYGKSGTFFGTGYYCGKTLAGIWVRTKCKHKGDGSGNGEWFANPFSDCKNCDCEGNACEACSSVLAGGKYMSGMDFAVYTDCIQGAVTGTGYIPTCDPLRPGLRDGFNFRIAYDKGAVQGKMNYSGGKYAGARKVNNAPVKWLVIVGNESWFGGDNWMVHVIDNGQTFTDDFFEIWINDPVSCTCYHCGGKLVGCYVHISYRYGQSCP